MWEFTDGNRGNLGIKKMKVEQIALISGRERDFDSYSCNNLVICL
jgi:hypothetical protein